MNMEFNNKPSIKLIKLIKYRIYDSIKRRLFLLLIGLFILNLTMQFGCAYSFTGASVPPHLKTIAIPVIQDRSGFAEPGLRESVTDKLIDKFVRDNSFVITDRTNADAILECTITSMREAPAVVASGETVSARRITISIQAVYRDLVQRKTIFDKSFSNFGDYADITNRSESIETAIDRITDDILLDTVSGW